LVTALPRLAFALKNDAVRGKVLAKRRAAGLGCENLSAAIADNGNEPLLHGKRPGRNCLSADRRENSPSTVPPAKLLRHAGRKGKYAIMWV
jgi:hypothetical protein